jgi:uncharacterized protein with GYD domain
MGIDLEVKVSLVSWSQRAREAQRRTARTAVGAAASEPRRLVCTNKSSSSSVAVHVSGEEHMPRFLALLRYTSEGSKVLLKETVTARETLARKAIESIGGKVESIYFTASGEYHIAMTAEYPDAAAAATLIAIMVWLR